MLVITGRALGHPVNTAIQARPGLPLLGHIFMALFTALGLDAFKGRVTLVAGGGKVGVANKIVKLLVAAVNGRQFAGAKGLPSRNIHPPD